MFQLQRLALSTACLGIAAVPLLLAAAAQQKETPPAKIAGVSLMPADALKWVPMPGLEGAQQAALFGDPTKEAHRIFYKWRPGLTAPLHTHTHGDRGVVISGTLALAVEGAPAKKLGPGSYFSMAGGTKHVTSVDGDAPCVFYIEREGAFDAKMVEEKVERK